MMDKEEFLAQVGEAIEDCMDVADVEVGLSTVTVETHDGDRYVLRFSRAPGGGVSKGEPEEDDENVEPAEDDDDE